jgi:hypothetical protein
VVSLSRVPSNSNWNGRAGTSSLRVLASSWRAVQHDVRHRQMSRSTILFVLLACSLVAVLAAERRALTGTYRIGGATFYDPPSDEPQNTHLYIELTGAAAQDLYEAISVKPRTDECTGPNTLIKTAGQIQCNRYEGGKRYRCWFGIDTRSEKITRGVVC